jgi:diguanylate cyclase (GGDEF)-like protein/PAS domain S-box-containing protein
MNAARPEGLAARPPGQVLFVADRQSDADLVLPALDNGASEGGTRWVTSHEAALAELARRDYACVLVTLGLPGVDGASFAALRLAAVESAIVVLADPSSEATATAMVAHGADDYLLLPDVVTPRLAAVLGAAVDRRQLRTELAEVSARYAAVMEALGDGLIVVGGSSRILSFNPAAERILGLSAADLVGRSVRELSWAYVGRDGSPVNPSELDIEASLESGQPLRNVVRGLRRPDGGLSWVEVNTHPLRSPHDGIDGVVVSVRDITDRLAATEDARFHAALLAAVGQAVIVTDPQGIVLYWNEAAVKMYGWSAAEALNRSGAELVRVDSNEQMGRLRDAVSHGLTWTGDFTVRRRDGTSFPALITETPLFRDDGHLRAVIGVSTDITERKRAEEAAQALSVIVESTADAIFTLDRGGTILTWNRGAEDLYGYGAAAMIGTDFNVLAPPEARERFSTFLVRMGAGESIRGVEVTHRRSDASLVDVSVTASPLRSADGAVVGASAIVRNISDQRRLERELSRQAMHDSLTGLPNRTLLGDRLTQSLAGAARRRLPVALLFLDLDRFKQINDTHGHALGDHVLVEVVRRLQRVIRPADTMARFGGDEFVILCEDSDEDEAGHVADRLAEALRDPIEVGGKWQHVSASIGIAVSPPLEADGDALLRYADTAMNDAKARGRARSRVFDISLATESRDRLDLNSDLGDALARDALEVHYQPVVELATGRLVGVEALTRWQHPVRGAIPPALFVSLAEESGLIAALDRWVLERACRDGAALRTARILPPDALLSVNVSARNVGDVDLVSTIRRAANAADFPLRALELEVTETATMAEWESIRGVLEDVRRLGVGIALDDFGTGYSSLSYVRQLPVTTIKIDHSFTRHIIDRRHDRAIASSVIDLARAVGLRTIAEGVETAEQLAVLHQLGCDAGQGFLWSKALPPAELTALLRDHPKGFLSAAKSHRARITARLGQGRSGRKRGRPGS